MTRMIDSKKHRSSPASALLLSSGLIGLFVGLAAQAEPMRPRTAEPMRVEMRGAMATRSVSIARGRSAVIDLPTEASDVFVANPKIADAVLRTPKRIFILGVESGTTDAMFYDRMGRQILALSVHVLAPTDDISSLIHSHFPNSKIEVQAANDHLVLSGAVANVAEADQVQRLAAAYVDDPKKILNFLTVSGKDQVMLKVRVIEVNRNTVKQLGFNTGLVTGQLGQTQYSLSHNASYGVNNKLLGGITGGYSVDTTKQPVAGYPVSNLFSGLTQGASSLLKSITDTGLTQSGFVTAITNFLTGAGTLQANQATLAQNYVTGLIGTTSTDVTDTATNLVHTVTANSIGVTPTNITSFTQAYLNGGTLTQDQRLWLNKFYSSLPSYNNANLYSLGASSGSTYIDRNNPANPVLTNQAGSTGVNQANATIQAFERVGLVRTLAEPNLTAVSGESAKFLAGGEFPIPVAQDNQGRVTLEFKPFGVGLGFTPVVMSAGRISLRIETEVSELSNDGALQISNSLTIPGLSVRRASTTVEMASGQSMMIAGLLQNKYKQSIDSLPGMTTLPVLGALFRSRDFINSETEMVVIVTPYIANATNPDSIQSPADNLDIPDDSESVFLGKLNKVIHARTGVADTSSQTSGRPAYQAPVGYVIE